MTDIGKKLAKLRTLLTTERCKHWHRNGRFWYRCAYNADKPWEVACIKCVVNGHRTGRRPVND